jgi:hypothetical protein
VTHPGIQIADVFASALAFALRNPHEDISRRWLQIMDGSISEFSAFPDVDRVDLESERGFVNSVILQELVLRSQRKADLFAGMPAMIGHARAFWCQQRLRGGPIF